MCSDYLARLPVGGACRVFVRASSFRLPPARETPILMFGPGTGIAPMRALLHERAHMRAREGAALGRALLYFGCKHRELDYLYREELERFEADGDVSLRLAFSREGAEKVYVQHVLARPENAAEAWELVDARGAHVYVCGGTAMGADVHNALLAIVRERGGRNDAQASAYVDELKAAGRYVQELWA